MRGYRQLRKSDRLDLLNEIKRDLENAPLEDVKGAQYIFHAASPIATTVVRQYLLARCAGLAFNEAVLAACAPGSSYRIHTLPGPWRAVLKAHGVPVSEITSRIAWSGYLVLAWGYGVWKIARIFFALRPGHDPTATNLGGAAYFDQLVPLNIPESADSSETILAWYARSNLRPGDVTQLLHDARRAPDGEANGLSVRAVPSPLPAFADLGQAARFLHWGLRASARSLWDLIRGKWWQSLLSSEAAKTEACKIVDSETLAREYWFHNSGHLYRPLWTYVAEQRGAGIVFYTYSTNFRVIKHPGKHAVPIRKLDTHDLAEIPRVGSWSSGVFRGGHPAHPPR